MPDNIAPTSFRYKVTAKTIREFHNSRAFVRVLIGGFGTGKTSAAIMECWLIAGRQQPGPDGKRRTRFAIVRNTTPELLSTTIKSFQAWIAPESGRWSFDSPITFTFARGDVEAEFVFIAMDRPEDTRRLLSSEYTAIFLNELRELPRAVLDAATGRVRRYPGVRQGGCTFGGVLADTNPCDSDSWLFQLIEEEKPEGFAFFKQPSGRSPEAENVENLPPNYYELLSAGKSAEWIACYVDGLYAFVQTGKPCYPEYCDRIHCQPFELDRRWGLRVGLDFGLSPAATIGSMTPMGAWRVRHELVATRMGATALADELARFLQEHFPNWPIDSITGDPAGAGGGNDDQSVFQILRANGIDARPAATNDFTLRRDAVGAAFSRLIDGEPGLLIHPDCKKLRKACAGGYALRRVAVSGAERYTDKPLKDEWSHVAESLQYMLLGGGAGRLLTQNRNPAPRAQFADGVEPSFFDYG